MRFKELKLHSLSISHHVGRKIKFLILKHCLYSRVFLFLSVVEKTEKAVQIGDPNLNKVVDAYTHAVTARFPKARFVTGDLKW